MFKLSQKLHGTITHATEWRGVLSNGVNWIKNTPASELFFYIFLFFIPIQTRILFNPEQSYINWYFSYHLAIFLYLSDILAICFIVSWIFLEKPLHLLKDRKTWLILGFFLTVLISMFHPVLETLFQYGAGVKHSGISIYETLKWAEILLIILYIYDKIRQKAQFLIIYWVLFVSGVSQALLGTLQFHVQHQVGLKWLGEYVSQIGTSGLSTIDVLGQKIIRAYGTFSHPNILAGFLLVSLFIGLYLVSRGGLKSKIFVGFGLIILYFGLFSTFSRVSWAIAGLGTLIYLIISVKHYVKHRSYESLFLLILVLIVSYGTIIITQKDLLISRSTELTNNVSLNYRAEFNSQALTIFKQNPIIGVGVGEYIPTLRETSSIVSLNEPWKAQPPHNIFLFVAVELGFVGLILFILILISVLRFTWNKKHLPLVLNIFLILSSFVVVGLFDHYLVTIQQGRLIFSVILGLAIASNNLKEKNHINEISN